MKANLFAGTDCLGVIDHCDAVFPVDAECKHGNLFSWLTALRGPHIDRSACWNLQVELRLAGERSQDVGRTDLLLFSGGQVKSQPGYRPQ